MIILDFLKSKLHSNIILKTALKIFTVFILMCTLVFSVVFAVNIVLGYHPYIINSNSMSDTINKGDMIFVKDIDPFDLKTGDIITFKISNSNITATHQIIEIDAENGLIYTKGINNPDKDGEPVLFSNVIGKFVYKIPGFGFLVNGD